MLASVGLLLIVAFILRLIAASLRGYANEIKREEIERDLDTIRW
jgi:hypothetical protein